MSNTPEYQGEGQPVLSQSTGFLGRLGGLLGHGGAPAYQGTGQPVLVVTADRGLAARVRAAGAEVTGPGALLRALDHQRP